MAREFEPRVLPAAPVQSIDEGCDGRAGEALRDARAVDAGTIVDLVDAAGLRGRGGAGFPTARKWRTVIANSTPLLPPTVVVNAAEGEPGSFKDREILRRDPYRVIEGALDRRLRGRCRLGDPRHPVVVHRARGPPASRHR